MPLRQVLTIRFAHIVAVDASNPAAVGQWMRIDVVHACAIPITARREDWTFGQFAFPVGSGCQFFDFKYSNLSAIYRKAVLGKPKQPPVPVRHPPSRASARTVACNDRITRMVRPGPHQIRRLVEAQSVVLRMIGAGEHPPASLVLEDAAVGKRPVYQL